MFVGMSIIYMGAHTKLAIYILCQGLKIYNYLSKILTKIIYI